MATTRAGRLVAGLTAVTATLLAACAMPGGEVVEVSRGTVLRDVTVVDTRSGALTPHATLVLDAGRIQRVVTGAATVKATGSAQVVDAAGRYVVPGYLDMHTHALPAADQKPGPWPMLLAHGVTGIREMAGSPALIQRARQFNADRAAGRIDAPEILQVPGDLFVGRIAEPAAAIAQVQAQKAAGADFIKVTNSNRAVTLALLDEARRQGLGVAGHLPLAVTAREASDAGWRAIEHLGAGYGALLDCATAGPAVRQAMASGEGAKVPLTPLAIVSPLLYRAADAPFFQRVLDSQDGARCDELAQAFARNATWQVPTLIRLRTMAYSDDSAYRNAPALAYVDKTTVGLWQSLAQQWTADVPVDMAATFRRYYDAELALVRRLNRHGVPLLAGSDLGGIWVIPGVALHQEFRELAAAGLTPLQVLQATTLNGARFLGREASMGTVEAGKVADLVLLDADPLADVANLSHIHAVVLRGKLLERGLLDGLKAQVARTHADEPPPALAAVLDAGHVH